MYYMSARIAEILALGEGEPCLTRVERYSLDLIAIGNDKSIFWNYIYFKVKRNKSKDKVQKAILLKGLSSG